MQNLNLEEKPMEITSDDAALEPNPPPSFWIRVGERIGRSWGLISTTFLIGLAGGFLLGSVVNTKRVENLTEANLSNPQEANIKTQLIEQINPPEGYALEVKFEDIGPQLLAAGAVDYEAFSEVFEVSGRPLSEEQIAILSEGSEAGIVFNRDSAHFLLNFFWALGLANENPILTEGPMIEYSEGQIERFASTGGWTIASKPITELYASTKILPLTAAQQKRVDEVAEKVYRPCCNNPTHFPDCNHGMAMLGLLELMASHDATVEQMFEAAKYANAYWFPQQTLEIALFHKSTQGLVFADVDPEQVVGPSFSSGAGFQAVHQWLIENGIIEGATGGGNNCGV